MADYHDLEKKAKLIRKLSLTSTTEAGSGHPTSSLSSADLGTVLFENYYTYDLKNPQNPNNDRFILSKGHASPLFYALYAVAGAMPLKELETLRKFGSRLEGHPTKKFPYTDVATGSLGQGLSVGAGMALAQRARISNFKFQISNLPKVYVLMGDGEMAEGSVWEAANFASYYGLDNLIGIVDVNRLGQSQQTMFGENALAYKERFSAFGWEVVVIDGHNLGEIDRALKDAASNKVKKPFVIIAKTKKGKGISFLEDKDGWHGKPLKKEDLEKALKELGEVDEKLRFTLRLPKPAGSSFAKASADKPASISLKTNYKIGDQVATREVYGEVLAKLGDQAKEIYALDGDVKNSTYSQDFLKAHPERFVECFIAEQNMAGVALGLSVFGKKPFVSTFAAFLTRAFDQIRMARLSEGTIVFCGSHAGVSIGEDGASQMGLEDIAMFGTLPDAVVLHPSDAVSTAKLMPQLLANTGISYIRTLRPKTAVLYKNTEEFKIGGSKILQSSKKDVLTVVAAGITVHEALKAYEELKKEGIFIRVVDCYSIKPIDADTLIECTRTTKENMIVTVEDHFAHGGLGDFVMEAVAGSGTCVEKMAVYEIGCSGKPEEMLDFAKISAKHIVEKVKESI